MTIEEIIHSALHTVYSNYESMIKCVNEGMEFYRKEIGLHQPYGIYFSAEDYDIIKEYECKKNNGWDDDRFIYLHTLYGLLVVLRAPDGKLTPGCALLVQKDMQANTTICIVMMDIYGEHIESDYGMLYSKYEESANKFLTR